MKDSAVPQPPVEDDGPCAPTLQALLTDLASPDDAAEAVATPDAPGLGAGTATPPELTDAVAVFGALERSGRFHRDKRLGRLYHPGSLSLRENVANNSLHVTIDGNRVSAHVDRVSPLGLRPEKAPRYSLARVALHNLSGMASDVGRVLRGRKGDHRCELDCEWMPPTDPAGTPDRHLPLVEPRRSPWGVHLEARVSATLDEDRLRRSLASAAPGDDRLSVVDCADNVALEQARVDLQSVAVPLDDRPPLRARLARHPDGDVFMLNVNHATADGPGALMVLGAVARAYAESAGPGTEPVDFLASQDLPVRPVAARRHSLARRYLAALEKARDVLARPTRLMPDHASKELGHGFHLVTVEVGDPASLATVRNPDVDNDILVAALHLAVSAWNADHGRHDGRIAVLVPVDLRGTPWPQGVVGNFSVTARVSTTPAERASPAGALRAVAVQTARNIRSRTGTALMDALDRNGLLALWARQSVVVLQPLTANHLLDSAVLSYVGRMDTPSFGDDAGEVTALWTSTPARMPLGLSVGAAVVSGRLHLTFRYPHRLFAPEAARRFAELYLAQIRLVATASPPADS